MQDLPDLREIVKRLGGTVYHGGKSALVPSPGHSRKDRGLSLTVKGGRLLWHSHNGAKAADVWAHLGLERGLIREETPAEKRQRQVEERRERERKLQFCGEVWRETLEAERSLVHTYLRCRGITGEIPQSVRFHPAAPLRYPWNVREGEQARTRPAMVAIATSGDGTSAAGIHVTFLQADGSAKASMPNARFMFGDLGGAVVQLGPLPADGVLGVAEGIETALAFHELTGIPTWAALSMSGLRRFTPPPGLSRLVIAADADDGPKHEGMEAARVCAERASRRCECVIRPAPDGQDWNDVLIGSSQ